MTRRLDWLGLVTVTPPALEPVSLDDALLHCRITATEESPTIARLIAAAREYAEGISGRAFLTQTLELTLDDWPERDTIKLPKPPLQSVTSIKYTDADGTETTVDAGDYVVDASSTVGRVTPADGVTWPTVSLLPLGAIRVRYVAGYGAARSDVPAHLAQAVLLLVGYWFEHREEATERELKRLPIGIRSLLHLRGV